MLNSRHKPECKTKPFTLSHSSNPWLGATPVPARQDTGVLPALQNREREPGATPEYSRACFPHFNTASESESASSYPRESMLLVETRLSAEIPVRRDMCFQVFFETCRENPCGNTLTPPYVS